MKKMFLKGGSLLVAGVFAIGICLALGQGCVTVKTKPSPEIQALLFKEAGFNLAYYTMWNESTPAVNRAGAIIGTGIDMLETTAVPEMVFLMTEYIRDAPQFQTSMDRYAPLIISSTRLLNGLLDVNLEVPEEKEGAVKCLRAFFGGALDGIMEISRGRSVGIEN